MLLRLCLALLLSPSLALSQDFTGRVVGVMDGDTIEVLHNRTPQRIRLYGIDCPEKGQAFGQRAKKATSDLAFGHQVTIHPIDKDRYGRTVANVVLSSGKILNHELIKGGWCWWFRKYALSDNELEGLEQTARQSKKGLWIDPKPVPPWEYRKAQRSSKSSRTPPTNPTDSAPHTPIVGNEDSRLYHRPDCPSYGLIASENRVEFATETEAEAAGYRLAGNCT